MKILRSLSLAATLASMALQAVAVDAFPAKAIRWVVGYAPGGGSDTIARAVGAQIATQTGRPVIVDNRPGGATVIASELVAKSPPDGYTVFSADNGTLVYNTALFEKLSYDPQKDFVPVGLMTITPLVLVVDGESKFTDAKSVIEEVRRNPAKYSYGSPGIGSPHHLAMEMLKERNKIDIVHIPYKGSAPAIQDLMGKQIPLMILDLPAGAQMIRAGRLKPLATFSKSRLPTLPDVPTFQELGLTDVEAVAWASMVVPAATPPDIVTRLGVELRKALSTPAVKSYLENIGIDTAPSDSATVTRLLSEEMKFWPKLIRERNIRLD